MIYRELDRGRFVRAILDAGRSSAVILFLLAAAGPFGWLLSEAQVNQGIRDLVWISTDLLIVLVMINIFLLLIGKEPIGAIIVQIIPFVLWSLTVLALIVIFPPLAVLSMEIR